MLLISGMVRKRLYGGPTLRCELKAPPSRKEREEDGAPSFGCGERVGHPSLWVNVGMAHPTHG
jgi:hypothetical protein